MDKKIINKKKKIICNISNKQMNEIKEFITKTIKVPKPVNSIFIVPGIKVDSFELIELLEVIKHAKKTLKEFSNNNKDELFPFRCEATVEDLNNIGTFFRNSISKINQQ